MKYAPALFLFCSLAFCQDAQERPITNRSFSHVHLLPVDYFTSVLQPKIPKLREDWLKPEALRQDIGYQPSNNWNPRAYGASSTGPAIWAPETAGIQLSVIKQHYHRLGHGGVAQRLGHSIWDGVSNVSEYNTAVLYYQQYGAPARALDPRAMYDYGRNRDPLVVTGRQLLNSIRRATVNEFRPKILLKWPFLRFAQ